MRLYRILVFSFPKNFILINLLLTDSFATMKQLLNLNWTL